MNFWILMRKAWKSPPRPFVHGFRCGKIFDAEIALILFWRITSCETNFAIWADKVNLCLLLYVDFLSSPSSAKLSSVGLFDKPFIGFSSRRYAWIPCTLPIDLVQTLFSSSGVSLCLSQDAHTLGRSGHGFPAQIICREAQYSDHSVPLWESRRLWYGAGPIASTLTFAIWT